MALPKYSQPEQTTPTTYPQADWQGLFFDSSDSGKLKRIDDAGTVVSIEGINGTVGLDEGGTGADLSSGQGVLVQTTSGAVVSSLGGTGLLKLASDVPSVASLAAADLPSFMGFKAYLNANQTIAGGFTRRLVNLDAVTFDTDSGFNTTTHKYTIPRAGYWLVIAKVTFLSATSGLQFVSIYKNGVEVDTVEIETTGNPRLIMTSLVQFATSDTLSMYAIFEQGGDLNGSSKDTNLTALWLGD
jgi:hypothetical protein